MPDDASGKARDIELTMIQAELSEVKTVLQVVVEMLRRQLIISGVPAAEVDAEIAQRSDEIRTKMQQYQFGLLDAISGAESKP